MVDSAALRPILVPVDFSPSSRAALLWAAPLATKLPAPLAVLHVVHDRESAPGAYRLEDGGVGRLEEVAGKQLERFLAEVRADRPDLEPLREAGQTLVVGLPVNRILEVAESLDAQLIVMGSQGLTGLPKLLLGSKAERVVQLSPVPVTIVKAPDGEEKP